MLLTSEHEHKQVSYRSPRGKQQQSNQNKPKFEFHCPYCEGEEHFLGSWVQAALEGEDQGLDLS